MSSLPQDTEVKLLADEQAVKMFVSASIRDWNFYADRKNQFLKEIKNTEK